MKMQEFILLRDEAGFAGSDEWRETDEEIRDAIAAVHWPADQDGFTINPTLHGNGVKPIKEAFVTHLGDMGWAAERRSLLVGGGAGPIDALKDYRNGDTFVCEWETGNISSSHRAMNKMAVALKQGNIVGGALVLPDRNLYRYLTDRIGNVDELVPYFPLWEEADFHGAGLLGIYVVTYDNIDTSVPLIRKGTDGRALA